MMEILKTGARNVPQTTVRRLSIYLRTLGLVAATGADSISSQRLAQLTGLTAAQVRRDLAYFGNFGKRGVGYSVKTLQAGIKSILGIDGSWRLALVGVGNLGRALLAYRGFEQQGFKIVAAFDIDQRKVGALVAGLQVEPVENLERRVREHGIQLAIVAVPADAAQAVLDRLVAAGIRAVLNFAPRKLEAPEAVRVSNVDLSIEVEYLSYSLTHQGLT